MPQPELVKLDWPVKGIVENAALIDQPELTTTDCLNVRAYDVLDRRNRGGQRTGISKYITGAVNGSNSIQGLGQVVLAFDATSLVPGDTIVTKDFTDTVAYPDAEDLDVADTDFDGFQAEFQSTTWTTSNRIRVFLDTGFPGTINTIAVPSASTATMQAHYTPSVTLGTGYIMRFTFYFDNLTGTATRQCGVFFRGDIPSRDFLYCGVNLASGTPMLELQSFDNGGSILNLVPAVDISSVITAGDTLYDVEIQVNGNVMKVLVAGSQFIDTTQSIYSSNTQFGIYMNDGVGRMTAWSVLQGATPSSLRTTRLVAISGGSIYLGTRNDGLSIPAGGSDAVANTGVVNVQDAFQRVYTFDGTSTGYRSVNPITNVASSWQTLVTSGSLPVGATGTQFNVTGVNASGKTVTVAEDLSFLVNTGDFIEWRSSTKETLGNRITSNDGAYTVVSRSGTGPTTITVNEVIPFGTISGTIGVGNVGCRFGALYNGRLVLAGLETDPQNWFMSASQDPNNWDYFPATSNAQQAIAGNNGIAGRVGDVVTALASYSDDIMIIGMANSLARMNGDPAAGGRIDTISTKVGIAGPEAWTFDTGQNLFFFWLNGLYRMGLNDFSPVLISQGRLDTTFNNINIASKRVVLLYDPEWQGVHIFITDDSAQVTPDLHYFWDERNDAFWVDQYPSAIGPTVVSRLNADNPEDNAVLLGGHDSFIRNFSDAALDDDGTVITSRCRFTPINKGDAIAVQRLEDVTLITDEQSGTTEYRCFAGHSVENAEANADANTARVRKTLRAGRNSTIRERVAQNAHILEIGQAGNGTPAVGATWAYEGGLCRVAVMDRIRGRRV